MSLNLECRSLFRKPLINKWHTKQITLEGTLSDPMIVQLQTAANTSSIFVLKNALNHHVLYLFHFIYAVF